MAVTSIKNLPFPTTGNPSTPITHMSSTDNRVTSLATATLSDLLTNSREQKIAQIQATIDKLPETSPSNLIIKLILQSIVDRYRSPQKDFLLDEDIAFVTSPFFLRFCELSKQSEANFTSPKAITIHPAALENLQKHKEGLLRYLKNSQSCLTEQCLADYLKSTNVAYNFSGLTDEQLKFQVLTDFVPGMLIILFIRQIMLQPENFLQAFQQEKMTLNIPTDLPETSPVVKMTNNILRNYKPIEIQAAITYLNSQTSDELDQIMETFIDNYPKFTEFCSEHFAIDVT